MTVEEARLLTLAILAAGPGDLLDCYSEPIQASNGDRLYTVELVNEEGTRWFGLHSNALREESIVLVAELRRQFAPPPALSAQPA